jgi:hypothetical protein
MDIQLALRGEIGDKTRWVLFYESTVAAVAFAKDKSAKEKGSL